MRALLIINPKAGAATRGQVDLTALLGQFSGHTLAVEVPRSREDAVAAARRGVEDGYDRILAVGGDGTMNCMAAALAGTGVPLGIIPYGTVNVLARELGIPLDPMKALQVALSGKVRRVDLGEANGRYFTLMAGLGFDGSVVSAIVPRLKELFGSLAYVTTGLQVLTRYQSSMFHLTIGEESFDLPAWLLVVGNAGYYAYEISIASGARIDDGLLDIIVFAEQNVLDRLTQLGALFVGQHINHPNVWYFQAPALTITADPPVIVQLDGDPADRSPVDISLQRKALSVMVPEKG